MQTKIKLSFKFGTHEVHNDLFQLSISILNLLRSFEIKQLVLLTNKKILEQNKKY